MGKDKMQTVLIATMISVSSGVLLVGHLAKIFHLDSIAVALLGLLLLPWILTFAQSVELPGGWKIQMREMERRLNNVFRSERYSERGAVYLLRADKRNLPLAMHFLSEAVALNPQNVLARGRYAMALKQQGKIELALLEVNEALRNDPDDETLYYNRACYRSLLMQDEDTIFSDLEEAFRRFPGIGELADRDDDLAYARTTYAARFNRLFGEQKRT